MANSPATPAEKKGAKSEKMFLLQPGRGRRDPEAIPMRVVCTQRMGYYNHRRIKKGEEFDIWYKGTFKSTWMAPAKSEEAMQALAEAQAEAAERAGKRTKLPDDVAPRTQLPGQAPVDPDNGGAADPDGGGRQTKPVTDDDEVI